MKRILILLLSLLLLCLPALAEQVQEPWICMNCGQECTAQYCSVCSETRGCWTCVACGTRNLSSACMNCGKEKNDSLAVQAADPRLVFAFPAIRCLAAAGDGASLVRLAECYEKGIGVDFNADKAVTCLRTAGEAGYSPAWCYLGKMYDDGGALIQDYALALECYQKAADLGNAEAMWYIGSFYEEGTGVEQSYVRRSRGRGRLDEHRLLLPARKRRGGRYRQSA